MVSLLNGLSALGQGVSTFAASAGLEQQKAALAQQQTILADSLATTRETTLQGQQQTFQSGENTANRAATAANLAVTEAGANTRNAATNTTSLATTGMTVAGEMARTQATINAPPETIKLLRALGVPLPGATPQTGGSASSGSTPGGTGQDYTGAPNPLLGGMPNPNEGTSGASTPSLSGPRSSGGVAADGSVVPAIAGAAPPASNTSRTVTGAPVPVADPMDNPLVKKALGYPAAGSEDDLRRAVAADVNSDPAFKYQTAGQRATETELRVQVAKGAMTSPATQAANAAMIASYQIKPPDGFALSRPGAAETMAMVSKFNPEYQESRFPEINKAMSAFGSGKQGDITRSLDVGVQHLNVLDQAAAALGNGDVQKLNNLTNWFQQQFGVAAPTTFDGLKQIVATEVEKSVAGGIGSSADRDRLMQSLDRASSPAQLQAMTNGFRSLMAGQLAGLKTQYENDTGFKTGPFAFENKLGPETLKTLAAHSGTAPAPAASTTTPDPLAAARDAIAQGAPPGAVAKRLRDNGIDPSRLLSGAQDLGRSPGQD